MGFLGGMFAKRAAQAKEGMQRLENKDLMEAAVGIAVWVAFADGDFEDAEAKQLTDIIESNPSFEAFQRDIGHTVDKFVTLFRKSGKFIAAQKVEKELADIKGNDDQKQEVLLIAVTIAAADGQIEPEEEKVIRRAGKVLGLNVDALLADAA